MPDNDQQPATRADIRALRIELTAAIESAELRLAARLERAEHALLQGFRTFAQDQATVGGCKNAG